MQLQSNRLFQVGNFPPRAIPYSLVALRQDLERVRNAWDDCQASRDRNAIYAYLTAVYGLVAWWAAEGREVDRARRALRLRCLDASGPEDPFAAIIRCTADPAKADKRTRSKWSRVMRYAAAYKPPNPSPWITSSAGMVASTPALPGSLGGLGELRGTQDVRREDDGLDSQPARSNYL
jgi:hypothetical protein